MRSGTASGKRKAPAGPQGPFEIFISYRRADTQWPAKLLFETLADRFGREHVFLDVVSLVPGAKWLEEIRRRGEGAGAFLVLIGPRWLELLHERSRRRAVEDEEDVVKLELAAALRRGSGLEVLPVLVDGAHMPAESKLPGPLKPLARRQAVSSLRHDRWEDDVASLMAMLERVRAGQEPAGPEPVGPDPVEATTAGAAAERDDPPAEAKPGAARAAFAPDEQHYREVVEWMVEEGTVVPFLGSGANACDRDEAWRYGCDGLPDARELAAYLAERFSIGVETDLAQVSQYVAVSRGAVDLNKALREILTADNRPTSVHRFLASFPARLQERGLDPRYQLIATTNYDDSLERAFQEAEEPYDLAVYVAGGPHRGKFVHVPFDGEPHVVAVPNEYVEFPIDEWLELERTVILKIHGRIERARAGFSGRESYVITEDDYIDYLSQSPIDELVPVQLLAKLRESHYLFLGYALRDWSLRVFLQRIWGTHPLEAKSWAVQPDADALEKEFWDPFGVDLYDVRLADYVAELERLLAQAGRARAER